MALIWSLQSAMQIDEAVILVVDDGKVNREILSRRLGKSGFQVVLAEDGTEALKLVEERTFDLILLDVMMPGVDGLSVLKTVRQSFEPSQLPVIMTTAMDTSEDVVRALELGANDYVTKPINFPVLLARVQTQVGLKRATDALYQAYQEIKSDLAAASRIQQSLLPTVLPEAAGIEFQWRYEPCDELAGDTLHIFQLDSNHIGFYLVDVSGHGVKAALLASALRHVLSCEPGEGTLMHGRPGPAGERELIPPVGVAGQLNTRFPMNRETNQYFTFLYGALEVPNRRLRFTSAGHPPLILLRADGRAEPVKCPGPPIGFFVKAQYHEKELALESGDRILVYSDGVVEATNEDEVEFGADRLIASLLQTRAMSLDDSLTSLMDQVREWTGGRAQDDISVIGIAVR